MPEPNKVLINIDISLFNKSYHRIIDDHTPLILLCGGAGSGKSIFLSQLLVYDALRFPGINALVVRKVAGSLRASVISTIRGIISDWGINNLFAFNTTHSSLVCENGSQITFIGLDDPEKAKSIVPLSTEDGGIPMFSSIWAEEATELTKQDFIQLRLRLRGITPYTKRMFLTFNPIKIDHWLKKLGRRTFALSPRRFCGQQL